MDKLFSNNGLGLGLNYFNKYSEEEKIKRLQYENFNTFLKSICDKEGNYLFLYIN
jgi:hypothetical protein